MKTSSYNKSLYTAPVYTTFQEYIRGISAYGERPALSWFTRKKEEKNLTYQELTHRINSLRRGLQATGLTQGSHVAIISENSADWITAFLSITSFGCVAVCVDIEQPDDSIRDMVLRSDAQALFLSPTYLSICMPLLENSSVERIILMGGEDRQVESMEQLCIQGSTLLAAGDEPEFHVDSSQTAELVFTSGTTSQSKMVMLSQKAVMDNIRVESEKIYFYDRMFSSLPFYHTFGLSCAVLHALLRGNHLYINGDLKTVMRDLKLAQVDSILTVPLMVESLYNQIWINAEKGNYTEELHRQLNRTRMYKKLHLPLQSKLLNQVREETLGTLRLIACGGAHLNKEIAESLELMGVQVLQGYGITECCPLISVNCNYANKLGSVGKVMSNLDIRFEDGEVCVRGSSVMKGYYKDPEQTALVLKDGWFYTGDLGHMDKDGFLFLTGRKKNLIVFKNGKKISPEQLEDLLVSIPMVKEVMVSGVSNGSSADDVKLMASIYPDPQRTENLTSYEILEHLQQEVDKINRDLPIYQQIQMINIREKEFTKTATKKIKRHAN